MSLLMFHQGVQSRIWMSSFQGKLSAHLSRVLITGRIADVFFARACEGENCSNMQGDVQFW